VIKTTDLINKLAKETEKKPCKIVTYKKLTILWLFGIFIFSLLNILRIDWYGDLKLSRLIEALLIYALGILLGFLVIRLGFPDLNHNRKLYRFFTLSILATIIALLSSSYLLGSLENGSFTPPIDLWNHCVCYLEVSTLTALPSFLLIALVRKAAPMNSVLTVIFSFISGGLLAISFFHLCNPTLSMYYELFFSLFPIFLITLACFTIRDRIIENWNSRIDSQQKIFDTKND
jgi:Negative regulator of sigma F